jgi:acrylyl-CoA reductase (NADPH)
VLRSKDPRFQAGDRVVLNGYGLGEVHHGGYAERARVKGDWLIRLPENISTGNAMAIGTACWPWKRKASRQKKAMCW